MLRTLTEKTFPRQVLSTPQEFYKVFLYLIYLQGAVISKVKTLATKKIKRHQNLILRFGKYLLR